MKRLSLALGLISLAAVVVVGVPIFIRTPVWVDVTYHDLSAWNILHGGVHYRDVFETNLPGMVWLHALLRPVIGWSHEAIRVVDLFVFGLVVLLLTRIIGGSIGAGSVSDGENKIVANASGSERVRVGARFNWCGTIGVSDGENRTVAYASGSERGRLGARCVWFLVAAFLFYLFESEFIHCQRDGWMLLPAVLATFLRTTPRRWHWTILEGLLWGLAVWIKPHVLVPAVLVWLVSLRFRPRETILRETLWLIVGGLLAGGAGVAWLTRTGAWQPMWDVLLNWNQEYYSWSGEDLLRKLRLVSVYFAPFSMLHFVAVPVALMALFRGDAPRAILAALYLGWLAQATVVQKEFDYAHYPPTLLGLALLAAHRWPVGQVFLVWCITAGLVNEVAGESEWLKNLRRDHRVAVQTVLPRHPITNPDRLALWGRCWHDDAWELKDQLSFYPYIHCAPHWADLQSVADFLATKNLKDRELICWHDSTHPLYVWLGIKPGIRYPHVITALKFKSKREQIKQETFSSPARYVVSDLLPIEYESGRYFGSSSAGAVDSLPANFPAWCNDIYPWNQPVVFRAGRYVVHQVKEPKGEVFFPMRGHLD